MVEISHIIPIVIPFNFQLALNPMRKRKSLTQSLRRTRKRPGWRDTCCTMQVSKSRYFRALSRSSSLSILDWASVATISSRPEIESYPFSNVFSVCDGATTATSSGVPYFYLSVLEMSVHDLQVGTTHNLLLVTLTIAGHNYHCWSHWLHLFTLSERQPSLDERVARPRTVLRRQSTRPGGPEMRARHIHRSDGKGNNLINGRGNNHYEYELKMT